MVPGSLKYYLFRPRFGGIPFGSFRGRNRLCPVGEELAGVPLGVDQPVYSWWNRAGFQWKEQLMVCGRNRRCFQVVGSAGLESV